MTKTLRLCIAIVLLFAFAFITTHPADAQIGISSGQATGIVVGGAAIATGVGFFLYYSLRAPRAITGCLVSASDGTAIRSDGDNQIFLLAGDASGMLVGDRVKIKGKREKDEAGKSRFLVKKLETDYGPCASLPASVPRPSPPARR